MKLSSESKKLLSASFDILSRRDHSSAELADKLRKKDLGNENDIEAVIKRLQELKYLDDERYLRGWVEKRRKYRPRGILALRNELRAKGLDMRLINENVNRETIDESADAERLLKKKSYVLERLDSEARRQKIANLLKNRGFGTETIYKALESW